MIWVVKSIHSRIKKEKYVLWVTDKSGIFHLGNKSDYEQKAEAYCHKIGADIELESDPLWSIFDKVVHLLNNLRSKDHKVTIAYLYFIPKPHKVMNVHMFFLSYDCVYTLFIFIGRYSIKTDCLINKYTNNWHIQVFRSINSTIIRSTCPPELGNSAKKTN